MAERRLSSIPGSNATMATGRPSAIGRMSLGPARVRGSGTVNGTAAELAEMSLHSSATMGLEQNGKAAGIGRSSMNPRESLNRRSSAFGVKGNASVGGAGSALLGVVPGMKDPRPIRDKAFQLEVIKALINFLAKAGYPHPISQKILIAPSAKDFQNIFKFLYGILDPGYDICAGGKKFEEEVPVILKGLRYPFAGDISKSQLYAVGSIHAWPGLLAALGWMVDLITCFSVLQSTKESANHGEAGDNFAPMASELSENSKGTLSPERLFFEYLCKAYKSFLAGNDNFDDLISELGTSFDKQQENISHEIEELRSKILECDSEYQTITSDGRPLVRSQQELAIYETDIEKFRKFIDHLEMKKVKFQEAIVAGRNDLRSVETAIQECEQQRNSLQCQIDARSISVDQIDQLNDERESLKRTLESLHHVKEEAMKTCWDRELVLQKRLDDVEKLLQQYSQKIEQIGSISSEVNYHQDRHPSLQLNPNANRSEEMIIPSIRDIIIPAFNQLRGDILAKLHESQAEIMTIQENIERLRETFQDRSEELKRQEKRLEKLSTAYTEMKESFAIEDRKAEEEAEQLEQSIQKIRSDIAYQTLNSQQRLQRAAIEYDQLVTQVASEKEKIGGELYRVLEDLINFKTNIESSLEDLELSFQKEVS